MSEFDKWAASYFSWEENRNKDEIESCEIAWNACKRKILNELKQPLQNADLSWEDVDLRFIKKIEEDI